MRFAPRRLRQQSVKSSILFLLGCRNRSFNCVASEVGGDHASGYTCVYLYRWGISKTPKSPRPHRSYCSKGENTNHSDTQLNIKTIAMSSETSTIKIGVVSMGEMGTGIAKLLIAHGYPVATNVQGRRLVTLEIGEPMRSDNR